MRLLFRKSSGFQALLTSCDLTLPPRDSELPVGARSCRLRRACSLTVCTRPSWASWPSATSLATPSAGLQTCVAFLGRTVVRSPRAARRAGGRDRLYEHHHPPTTYLAAFLLPASLGPGFAD